MIPTNPAKYVLRNDNHRQSNSRIESLRGRKAPSAPASKGGFACFPAAAPVLPAARRLSPASSPPRAPPGLTAGGRPRALGNTHPTRRESPQRSASFCTSPRFLWASRESQDGGRSALCGPACRLLEGGEAQARWGQPRGMPGRRSLGALLPRLSVARRRGGAGAARGMPVRRLLCAPLPLLPVARRRGGAGALEEAAGHAGPTVAWRSAVQPAGC